jgi:LmbE family N-acetylglucosaminyl deacetylase
MIVDVTETFERKLEMLACHESQRAWLLKQHGMDEYLESCRRWGSARGSEMGVEYGEAFRQHLGHPYPSDDALTRLLAGISE